MEVFIKNKNNGLYGILYLQHECPLSNTYIMEDGECVNYLVPVNENVEEVEALPKITKNTLIQWVKDYRKNDELLEEIKRTGEELNAVKEKMDKLLRESDGFKKRQGLAVNEYLKKKKLHEVESSVNGNEMMDISFYHGSLDTAKAKAIINKSSRPLFYTYGLGYRNPTTNHKSISKEEAFKIIDTESLLDIHFKEKEIHLNAYSENDMW